MNNKYLSHIVSIIEEAIKRKKTTAAKASREAVGNFFMVRNMQKGQSPRLENIKKLCDALGLECYIGFAEDYPGLSARAPIIGKSKKGKLFCEHNLALIREDNILEYKSISSPINKNSIVAFEINDGSLAPAISTGDTIFIDMEDRRASSQWEQFLGKPCLIQLKEKELLASTLRRGDTIGKWNLEPIAGNHQTLINQSPLACFPIRWVKKAFTE